jgi:thymidylate kinase
MKREKGKSICFIGLDGSGKSTSIEAAFHWCTDHGIKVKVVRAAYVVERLNWLIKLGKKLTMKKHSDPYKAGDYKTYLEQLRKTSPHGFKYRVFSFLTTLEFRSQIRKRITRNLKHGYCLLIDRYIYDNAVTYCANLGLGESFMHEIIDKKWKKAPRPDAIIFIDAPVKTCLSRKNDIPDPLYLEIREPLYKLVAKHYSAITINGSQPRAKMVEQVINTVQEVFGHGQ